MTKERCWMCVWKLISMGKKYTDMNSASWGGGGQAVQFTSCFKAKNRCSFNMQKRQEESKCQTERWRMKDGKLRSVKCFVKLILMWGTSLGCLTSSPGAEIILARSVAERRETHTHTNLLAWKIWTLPVGRISGSLSSSSTFSSSVHPSSLLNPATQM